MTETAKPLRRTSSGEEIWHYRDGVRVNGPHDTIWGDLSGIWGNVSGIRGEVSGVWGHVDDELSGHVTGLSGDVTGIKGNLNDIPQSARPCDILDWVQD